MNVYKEKFHEAVKDCADTLLKLELAVKALEEIRNVYNGGVASREANIAHNSLLEIRRVQDANGNVPGC